MSCVRVYFDKYTRYNSEKWIWQPYTYARNCSMEEQAKWNELYLKTRGRKDGDDKVIPDFYSIERDADQFGKREVTFTDIFGLKWTGKKGAFQEVKSPDYEGHLFYDDPEDGDEDDIAVSDTFNAYENQPNPNVYFKFEVGHPRWRKEWIDIANVVDIKYHFVVENHLFKDTRVELIYGDDENVQIFDSHNYSALVEALKKFNKTDLLQKFYEQVDLHFEKLRTSERNEEREYWPGTSAEEYFAAH